MQERTDSGSNMSSSPEWCFCGSLQKLHVGRVYHVRKSTFIIHNVREVGHLSPRHSLVLSFWLILWKRSVFPVRSVFNGSNRSSEDHSSPSLLSDSRGHESAEYSRPLVIFVVLHVEKDRRGLLRIRDPRRF